MKSDLNFNTYQSPFSWRYGSDDMRQIFSEINKRKLWRKIWLSLAKFQQKAGLVTKEEFKDLEKNVNKIDIKKALDIEKEIYHDLMSEIKVYASTAKVGGGKIHLGATSMDIEDNADIIRVSQALEIVESKLKKLIKIFAVHIKKYQSTVCMGYTHLQPAEPTTLGYRFSIYVMDLLNDLRLLRYFKSQLTAKGMKGAVGTSASYVKLLEDKQTDAQTLSSQVMQDLGLKESLVSSQTYPRKTDLHLTFILSSIAQSINKFAFDLRIMQSPNFGEWSEPISEKRVGSSAMPFKKNPDKAEKICSLARYVSTLVNISWDNAASSLLERTLDDSANRRIFIPEGFLAIDEILTVAIHLTEGLVIRVENLKRNLEKYGPFSGTESLMMEAVKRGANRQEMHEAIRTAATCAWDEINKSGNNPLVNILKNDKIITTYIEKKEIPHLIDPVNHTGLAQKKCLLVLKEIDKEI